MPATRRIKKRGVRSRKMRGGDPNNGKRLRFGPTRPRRPPPNKPVPPPTGFGLVSAQIQEERAMAEAKRANYAEKQAAYAAKIAEIRKQAMNQNNKTEISRIRQNNENLKTVRNARTVSLNKRQKNRNDRNSLRRTMKNSTKRLAELKQKRNQFSFTKLFRRSSPLDSEINTLQRTINGLQRNINAKESLIADESNAIYRKTNYINERGPIMRPNKAAYNAYKLMKASNPSYKPNPPPTKNSSVSHLGFDQESDDDLNFTVGPHQSEKRIPGNQSIVMNLPKEPPKTFLQRIGLRGGKTRKQQRA